MKKNEQFTRDYAMEEFQEMLIQWYNNATELSRRCKRNPKVMEMLQSLCEAVESVNNWSDLPGSVMLVVAYQPGMFDDEDYGKMGEIPF